MSFLLSLMLNSTMREKLIIFLQSLTIILCPLYIVRFNLGIPTTLLELLLLLTFLVTFWDFAASGLDWRQVKTRFDFLILIFLSSAILATLTSFDVKGGLGILKAYFIEPVLFFYCLVYQMRITGSKYLIVSLISVGIWLSLLSLVQKLTGQYSLAPAEILQGRITAVYNSANSLALFLVPIIILSVSEFTKSVDKKKKLIWLFLFSFFSLIIIWTKSRGGLIAEIIALITFVYVLLAAKSEKIRQIWYIPPIIAGLLLMMVLVNFYNHHNFFPATYGLPYTGGDTLQIRYYIWAGTIRLLNDHPVFGAGLNGFKTLYSNEYRPVEFQEQFQYPHNIFLTFWTELGLSGLFSFLLLFISALSLVIRNIFKSRDVALGAGFIAIFCYILAHGMVDVPYFKNDLALEFWIILALVINWSNKTAKRQSN